MAKPVKPYNSELLVIGDTVSGEPITVDAAKLVDSRLLGTCNSGGGKSHLLRVLVEQVGATIPTIVLDPEGEFASLREKLDMVLVGSDGDVDADPRSAALLCRKLIELRLSAVIDLYALKMHERRMFVKTFLEALIDLPQKLWGPTLIVLDEAHKFCMERGSGSAESTDAVISLMSQGRKRGFGGVLVTQRLSKLHKDAVGECNNVLIGRCVQDVDLKRSGDILGLGNGQERNSLRTMKPGDFFGFGPAFGHDGVVKFRTRPCQTTHPDARTRHAIKPPAPSKAILKVLPELADLPARAADEKATLEASQAEANRLGRELEKLRRTKSTGVTTVVGYSQAEVDTKVQAAVQVATERAVAEVEERYAQFHEGLRVEMQELFGKIDAINATATEMTKGGLQRYLQEADAEIAARKLRAAQAPAPLQRTKKKSAKNKRDKRSETYGAEQNAGWMEVVSKRGRQLVEEEQPSRPQTREACPRESAPVSGIAERILVALLQQGKPTSKVRAALLAGTKSSSSTFRAGMAVLRATEPLLVLDRPDGDLEATAEAERLYTGAYEPLPTSTELISFWRDKLSGIAQRIFDALVAADGGPLDMEALAEVADTKPSSSTLRAGLAKLRSAKGLGLIVDVGRGQVALCQELME